MPSHHSLRSIVRKNLLELSSRPLPSPGDPFRPLSQVRRPRPEILPLSAAVGPSAPNRPNDVAGVAVSANGRLVRHLMTTTADGMVPDLMAADFRANERGRAKTADFLSQLFQSDKDRARSLRDQAGAVMSDGEKTLLDRLIIQARLADEPDDGDEQPPEEEPPFVPDDPGQDDQDEDEPDEPEPEKPKPDEEKCKGLESQVANAEATVEKQEAQVQDTEQELATRRRELEGLENENKILDFGSAVTGIAGLFPALRLPGAATGAGMSGKAAVNESRIKALRKLIPELERRLELFKQDLETEKAKLAELQAKLEECKGSSG